jgi:hypothetical protein
VNSGDKGVYFFLESEGTVSNRRSMMRRKEEKKEKEEEREK